MLVDILTVVVIILMFALGFTVGWVIKYKKDINYFTRYFKGGNK